MPGVRADIVQLHPFRIRNGRVEHLLLRRCDGDELCPGAWQVITGGMNAGETATDAAERELDEETGFVALRWFVTGRVATYFFEPFDSVVLSPIIACEVGADSEPKLSHEHSDSRWCSASEARSALTFAAHREAVDDVENLIADENQ